MAWRAEREFAADVNAPARARAFTVAELTGAVGTASRTLCDDALLIVSELVTNAVRAGGRRVRLLLSLDPDCLHIRVSDDAVGWPTPRTARPDDPDGRGLQMINAIASDWGVVARDEGGKHVWAVLPLT